MSKKYDYLVVGAGLYGAVFAHEAKKAGKSVLVCTSMAHIFFIQIIKKSGTTLLSLRSLTALRTVR